MSESPGSIRSTIQKRDEKGVVRHGAEWLALWSDPETMRTAEERHANMAAARERSALHHNLAAAARSLSGIADLDVALGDTEGAGKVLRIAERDLDDPDLAAVRGELDSRALFLRHHDPVLHAAGTPADPDEKRLFELCEICRCEALGARRFFGVRDNLVARHRQRLERSDLINAHLASLIPLSEALRMVLRDTFLGASEPSIASSGFWMWDGWLRRRIQPELTALAQALDDQALFGARAKALISALFAALGSHAAGPERRASSDAGERAGDDNPLEDGRPRDQDLDPSAPGHLMFSEDDARQPGESEAFLPPEAPPAYAVFTRAHDQVVHASTLAKPEELRAARETLDKKRAEYRRDLARLVTQLQRRLMARQTRSWTFDLEEGVLDASRLDRVVVNPGFADAYKQEEDAEFRDTAVMLLIDNSGSMRGKPIEIACVAADLVAAALERCGVSTEILGFTTRAFKGGHSAQDWAKAGRPAAPGRLNDLLHVVYKAGNEPLRLARNNLCAMLSPGLLKENIDGEALLWASRRLMQRPEARKLLIVVSDGAPVDEATLQANDDKVILDRHLRETVEDIRRAGLIELAAIGIKHDVRRLYPTATRIERVEELGSALVDLIDRIVTGRRDS